ncbi:MAG: hypothetical protein K2X03_14285 [Bryobacteraceae bacterium]|nr:hypothetical protein [Bryobacteraceae bacterium]
MRRRLSSPQAFVAIVTQGLLLTTLLTPWSLAQDVLNNSGVIKMVEGGLSEDFILTVVKQQNSGFTVNPNDLVELKKANVSERIIAAMMAKALGTAAAPPKPEAPKPKGPPSESGVYYKKGDGWAEVLTEEIAWSNAGVVNSVRNVASVGLLKKDVSGTIAQVSSRSMLTSPFELLIVPNSGVDIHSFLLVPLKRLKGKREIEVGPAKKGEAGKRAIPFGVEKVGANHFRMVFPSPLGPGEYGILPLNQVATENGQSAAPSGRVYTFRVLL